MLPAGVFPGELFNGVEMWQIRGNQGVIPVKRVSLF